MLHIPYVQTSVFIDERYGFGGNQLATYWNREVNVKLTTETMQNMALEMNFSESTFIEEPTSGEYAAKVRIFTPAREIPFAGHPTVGTAFVLKHQNLINKDASDAIPVSYLSDGSIRMKQNEPEFLDIWGDKVSLASALNIDHEDIATGSPMQWVSTGFPFLIVPLKSLDAVKRASPNPSEILGSLEGQINKQVMIFSIETENDDSHVHTRMFAPEVGVVEDPATGSAAGPLTAYLEQYNILNREKRGDDIVIEQGYEIKRPSRLVGSVIGENDFIGVCVSGKIRLVAEGTFYLDE